MNIIKYIFWLVAFLMGVIVAYVFPEETMSTGAKFIFVGAWGAVLGFVFYITNIRLPEIPHNAMEYISNMNTPLAMLIAGATVAQTNILKAFKGIEMYRVCAGKLIIVPAVTFALVWLTPAPDVVKMVVTIAAGCPVATTGTMFAITMDRHPQKCSEFFAVTTVLSGLTLPLLTMVCDKLI